MTDEPDDYNDDAALDGEQQQYGDNPNLRQLREKAKKHDSVVAERDNARRELAFYRAGIPDSKLGQLFMKAYDGDVDPEAIKAAAADYGLIDADISNDELAAQGRFENAAAGGVTSGPPTDFNAQIRAAAGHRPN